MKKEIAESAERARQVMESVLDEKTKEGDTIIIVGVGNTLGVAQ